MQRAVVVANQQYNEQLARDKVQMEQRKSEKEMNNDRLMARKELEEIERQDKNNRANSIKKKKQIHDDLKAMMKE